MDSHVCLLDFSDHITLRCLACNSNKETARPIIVLVTAREKLLLSLYRMNKLDPRGKAWREADEYARTLGAIREENTPSRTVSKKLEASTPPTRRRLPGVTDGPMEPLF